jgi:two-component system response regulator HydG
MICQTSRIGNVIFSFDHARARAGLTQAGTGLSVASGVAAGGVSAAIQVFNALPIDEGPSPGGSGGTARRRPFFTLSKQPAWSGGSTQSINGYGTGLSTSPRLGFRRNLAAARSVSWDGRAMNTNGSSHRGCIVWFGQPTEDECSALANAGWSIRVALVAANVGVGVRPGDCVVALADLRYCDAGMLSAMQQLLGDHADLPWLGLVSPDTSAQEPQVRFILQGCHDFFTAPIDMPRLLAALTRANGDLLREVDDEVDDMPEMIGRDLAMAAVATKLRKFAPINLPVLIVGETGTGKEVAARVLHRLSARRSHPFVPINCGAMPLHLVQSELFGHERGAFTDANVRRIGHIESASDGTVLLDEIGDLQLEAQTNLLRFLQEGMLERVGSSQPFKVNVRVVAATHIDLDKAVATGQFREDLYFRLNVLRLRMPPLRERGEDVDLLARHFLDQFHEQHGNCASGFTSSALRAMRRYDWPGNVRELLNRVQRAAVLAEGAHISAADLELPTGTNSGGNFLPTSLGVSRVSAEREAIVACLRESKFNISECARRLQISRVTVYRLCRKHRLDLDELR